MQIKTLRNTAALAERHARIFPQELRSIPLLAAVLIFSLGIAPIGGHAETVIWSNNGNGAWDTSTPNWNSGTAAYTEGDMVQFNDSAGLPPLTATVQAGGVSPASVNFTNGGVGTGYYRLFGGSINGATSLTLDAGFGGTARLDAANGYTGGTTLNSGTLIVGSSSALGIGTLTLNGGTLRTLTTGVTLTVPINATGTTAVFAGGGNLSLDGAITGAGVLNIGGSGNGQVADNRVNIAANTLNGFTGTLNLDNTENYIDLRGANTTAKLMTSGATSGQHIRVWGDSTFSELSGTGGFIAGDNKTLTINQSTDTSYAGVLGSVNGARSLALTKTGTGTLTLTGTNVYTRTTTVTAGTLKAGSTTAFSANSAFSVTGTLELDGNSNSIGSLAGAGTVENANAGTAALTTGGKNTDTTFSGLIQDGAGGGALSLVKNGTGTLTLSGTNTYTGGTTVNAGRLSWANSSSLGNGPLTVNGGLVAKNVAALTVTELSGTGGTIQLGRRALTVNQSANTTYAGSLQNWAGAIGGGNEMNLVKNGSGTLTLTGVSTYTQRTDINGGTLQVDGALYGGGFDASSNINVANGATLKIGGAGQLGSGTHGGGIANNGTFEYNSTTDQTLSGVISGTGVLIKDNTSTLTLTGANTYSGNTTINGGTLKLQGGAFATTARDYSIASGAILNIDGGANPAVGTSAISGAGALRITGGALAASSTGRNITMSLGSGGQIDVQAGAKIQNGGWQNITWTSNLAGLNVDGEFDVWDGNPVYVDALTGSGSITKNQGFSHVVLHVGVDNGSGTFFGTIGERAGAAGTVIGLTKDGSGTQTLTGTNTYSGNTTVNSGTLQIGGAGQLESGATGFYSGDITIDSGAVFQYSSSASNTDARYNGAISGDGTLIKDGSGSVLRLQGSTSVANIEINQGTLRVQGVDNALGSGGTTVSLGDTSGSNNATVWYTGSGRTYTTKAGIVVRAGSTGTKTIRNTGDNNVDNTAITLNDDVTIDDSNTLTLGGVISGNGSLTKNGAGTLSLTGNNTYSGDTMINVGRLLVNGPGGYSGGGTFLVGSGAQLGGSGVIDGSIIVGAGGSYSPGNSPGDQSVTNITFESGSAYVWDLYDAGPATGSSANYGINSWDHFEITGTLTLNTGAEIQALGLQDLLGPSGTPGLPLGLDISVKGAQSGPFDVLTLTGGVDGTLGFTSINDLIGIPINAGNLAQYGSFFTTISGNTLQLTFVSSVPEPGTWALFGLMLLAGVGYARQRKQAA